jgi:hypothetical protein
MIKKIKFNMFPTISKTSTKCVVSKAATAAKADKGKKRLVARYDISVAFFHPTALVS